MSSVVLEERDLSRRLAALYDEEDGRFEVLAKVAGLDPKRDFRGRDLRALDFSAANLAGYDFSESDLRGTSLRLAARIDDKTIIVGALLDQSDADWYDERIREAANLDAALVDDLRLAMSRNQFALVFQPKIALKTGAIEGAEVLLRWQHHELGNIAPYRFIPLLEDWDLIESVTLWMIESVIEQRRRLVWQGFDITISVNISSALIERAGFIANCRRLVIGQEVKLCFEVTEHVFVSNPEVVFEHFEQIASMGIGIALDDYGTGYSSFDLLRRLPARELKIDGSFVHPLSYDDADSLVVRSTIDLAHALGWTVTAEGVETASQLKLLAALGCDAAQGFFIAKPMAIDEMVSLLENEAISPLTDIPSQFRA